MCQVCKRSFDLKSCGRFNNKKIMYCPHCLSIFYQSDKDDEYNLELKVVGEKINQNHNFRGRIIVIYFILGILSLFCYHLCFVSSKFLLLIVPVAINLISIVDYRAYRNCYWRN